MASLIMPLMVLLIIIYALFKKVDIYNTFINGAKESYQIIINLFPGLLAMILGVNLFTKSGIFEYLNSLRLHIPAELISLMISRPISGSSSLLILNNIYKLYTPDSFIGILASVMQGSTDTTIYIITLYFSAIGIKKIRHSLIVGLLADISAFIIAYFTVTIML